MGINETVKSFLLQKHHEFASKTSLGRAAQRVWVKHQFMEKGILNPANYTQEQMNEFYGIIAANYIHLHETYPQVFSTSRVYDKELLGLPEGKDITHADLYLHRVIEKARTIEFRPISNNHIDGLAFSTGMIVDNKKVEDTRLGVSTFFRTGQYLTDPNCPKSLSTILQNSTFGLNNALGYILSSKEVRDEFLADPRGFLNDKLHDANHQLTPEQQQSFYAMISSTFVEAVRSNEEYFASIEARQAEQNFKETTSHEGYHLGLSRATDDLQKETLEQSYAKTDMIANADRSVTKERTDFAKFPDSVKTQIESSSSALNEIYVDLLASRTIDTPTVLNHYTQATGNVFYSYNAATSSAYTINEPILTLLENMVTCMDGSAVAIHNYLSGVVPGSREQEREFLALHPLFTGRTPFNIVGKNGKVSIPSQFKEHISEPKLYIPMSPFQTFCALTNTILTTRQLAREDKTPVNVMPMVQQTQSMLFQAFHQREIAPLAHMVSSTLTQNPTPQEMVSILQTVSGKEEAIQQMFANLVFTRDDSRSITECKEFITSTYGKGATLSSVLQSPKTVEEIQALIDNGIILESPNLASYMSTLSNIQSIREIVETSIITQNPNLTEEQLVALIDISSIPIGIDIESLTANIELAMANALGNEPAPAPDPEPVPDPIEITDDTLTNTEEALANNTAVTLDAEKTDPAIITETVVTTVDPVIDMGGDMGGPCE